jgi:hypothetical protein
MKIKIEIECNNSAFQPEPLPEVTSILRKALTEHFERGLKLNIHTDIELLDTNGNKVGFLRGYRERAK